MGKWKYIALFFIVICSYCACTSDTAHYGDVEDGVVRLRFQVSAPGTRGITRAVDEDAVTQVSVLVFENSGTGYVHSYTVTGYSLQASSGVYDYEFLARILPTTVDTKLYIIANAGSAVNAVTAGMYEEDAIQELTLAYTSSGFSTVLPMSGSVEFAGGINTDQTVTAVLIRSVARVDVVNSASDFILTSVKVYRANDLVQVIPNSLTGNSVTTASVPGNSTLSVDTDTYTDIVGESLTAQLYIPESEIPAAADRRLSATCVVIGGQYGGSGQTTYYRLDFIPDDASGNPDETLFGQVLRNHLYRFDIQEVLAPGWSDDDEAAQYPSTSIDANIVVWDEVDMDMVFDNYNYFGVSTRLVNISPYAGVTQTVSVQTDLDTYTAYWSDAEGNTDAAAGSITLGEDFDDPDGLFNVALSPDGTTITVTSLAAYDESADLPKYLTIVAGRLRITITVTQGAPSYRADTRINVYGPRTGELGSLGNFVLGTTYQPNDRTLPYVNLLQSADNFSPTGTVRIDGIFISGLDNTTTSYPAALLSLYDVLYLPYPYNPDPGTIISWINAGTNRVLIVHYDNLTTNAQVMAALGVAYTYPAPGTPISPYTLSTDAPDFITDGPFGVVDNTLQFRVRDNAFGRIDPAVASANNITPVLLTPDGTGIAMGIDQDRHIVYMADLDMYNSVQGDGTGQYIPSTGAVTNMPAIVLANLWAWIVDVVLPK